jgi:shikimate dehydrogenase
MEITGEKPLKFGLVGRNISYSFSKGYFTKKFRQMGLEGYTYENFDLGDIGSLPRVIAENPRLCGLNVTIPYKEAVIPYLDALDAEAEGIGAVNTIKIEKGRLTGYNTDIYGFREAILPFIKQEHSRALVLGTGGASKAVAHVLNGLGIAVALVSRSAGKGAFTYGDIDRKILEEYSILVNATPLGTFPRVDEKPPLPYAHLNGGHLLFDLIYNPEKTAFLTAGEARGAQICNGLRMLELQAEKAWEIWNS